MADDDGNARVGYKDLCIDVTDLDVAARFAGPLLGLQVEDRYPEVFRLGDGVPSHTVWLNRVPEPRTVKNRLHLDVDVAAVADVVEAGARVVDDRFPWTVLVDDQVGELCAFVREPARLQPYRVYELVLDCLDLERISAWWAERFGVPVSSDGENVWLEGGSLPWPLVFEPVPERKSVKNRVHIDVDGSTAEVLAAGATLLRARDDDISWDVLADPGGNEFCVFARD